MNLLPIPLAAFVVTLLLPTATLPQSTGESVSLAESGEPTISNYRDWTVQCLPASSPGQGPACAMVQQLLVDSGERLLAMQVSKAGTADGTTDPNLVAVFSLPLGVYLPTGLSIAIDKKQPIKVDYERCDRGGCYAGLELGENLTDGLKDGVELLVRFNNLDGRTISTRLSLNGFTAAHNALLEKTDS